LFGGTLPDTIGAHPREYFLIYQKKTGYDI